MKKLSSFLCFLLYIVQTVSLHAKFLLDNQVLKENGLKSSLLQENIPEIKQVSAQNSFNQNQVQFSTVEINSKLNNPQQPVNSHFHDVNKAQISNIKIDERFDRIAPKFVFEIVKQELREEPAVDTFQGLGISGNDFKFSLPVSNRINSYPENNDGIQNLHTKLRTNSFTNYFIQPTFSEVFESN